MKLKIAYSKLIFDKFIPKFLFFLLFIFTATSTYAKDCLNDMLLEMVLLFFNSFL
jgi:hypothetical protein